MTDAEDAEAEGDINAVSSPSTSVSGSAPETSSHLQSSDSEDIHQQPLTRRSHKQVSAPGYLSQHYVGYGLVAAVIPEPTSVKEARSSPDAQLWEQAMAEEMSSLYQNRT